MTKKIALLFPGQGSQYVGMGKNLAGTIGANLFATADETLKLNLSHLMFEGPEEELKLTHFTQPAIVAHSLALLENLKIKLNESNANINYVLGHSVGEYAALAAAGVLTAAQAIQLVHIRGKAMQEATPVGVGKMFAILKAPQEKVLEACAAASTEGSMVSAANFNDPTQIVISGHSEACLRACEWLKQNLETPHRAIELNVSAPFHSSLMEPAAKVMAAELEKVELRPNTLPYIANIDAKIYPTQTDPAVILNNLVKQIAGSVMWTQSIQQLPEDTLCLEVGPGRVLQGLVKKINPNLQVISIDKEGALEELNEVLK